MPENTIQSYTVQESSISPTKRNDAKYDLIKFFLSIVVLAIHSNLYPNILYPWLRIAVPLFFIISSKFVFSKLYNATARQQKDILKKFVIRNLQLYLCWLVILSPVVLYAWYDGNLFSYSFLIIIKRILVSFFFGSTFTASWFIMATVIGVLIIFLLSKLLKNDFLVLIFALFAFCMVTLISSYKPLIYDTFLYTMLRGYTRIFGGFVLSYPAALFWVFIGKLFAEEKIKFKSTKLLIFLILCSAAGLFAEWKFVITSTGSNSEDSYFMLAPLCVLLFFGIEKIKPIYWEKSIYFKRASTIIYVSHGSIVAIIAKLLSIIFHIKFPLLPFILTFICCITIYIFIEMAIKKCGKHPLNKILKKLY